MSVPVNQRGHGKLEVCVSAHDLCCYTLQITENPKHFPEKYRDALTNRIVDTAISIHTLCWSANNILLKKGERDLAERLMERSRLQDEAAIECNNLLSLIDVAKKLFHLSTKRCVYWGEKAVNTRNLIRAWRASDYKRFGTAPHEQPRGVG